jgi:hypothetical protein
VLIKDIYLCIGFGFAAKHFILDGLY